jgi:two-component system chemotaxis response regulator CheB
MAELKVLIVDDSIVYLRFLEDLLNEIQGVTVVGKANDGDAALKLIPKVNPDLITLDVEMPILNGIECLRQVRKNWPQIVALMVSSHTAYGASVTMECLSLGAFDFLAKPDLDNPSTTKDYLRRQLRTKVNMIRVAHGASQLEAKELARTQKQEKPAPKPEKQETAPLIKIVRPIECVGIGISTGGPEALRTVLPLLPKTLRVPILIVQHMPSLFTKALADSLAKRCPLPVKEASDGELIKSGHIYISPGDHQMRVERKNTSGPAIIRVTQDPPENHCRPSVDYLFRSLAQTYQDRTLAIIMTGMGSDGAKGARLIARRGGIVSAQDKATSTIYGMPMEAIKTGVVEHVLPLDKIAEHITTVTTRRRSV